MTYVVVAIASTAVRIAYHNRFSQRYGILELYSSNMLSPLTSRPIAGHTAYSIQERAYSIAGHTAYRREHIAYVNY